MILNNTCTCQTREEKIPHTFKISIISFVYLIKTDVLYWPFQFVDSSLTPANILVCHEEREKEERERIIQYLHKVLVEPCCCNSAWYSETIAQNRWRETDDHNGKHSGNEKRSIKTPISHALYTDVVFFVTETVTLIKLHCQSHN